MSYQSYSECPTIKARVAFIKAKLALEGAEGCAWRMRAVVRLAQEQTADELANAATTENNARGFTAFDAQFLTSLAEKVTKYQSLSAKQDAALTRALPKYAAQLEKLVRVQS